jgi:hypothetical protein
MAALTTAVCLGLLTIFAICIARMFESNKVFWTLLTSLMMGFVVATISCKSSRNEGSKATTMQVQPTQALPTTLGSLMYLLTDDSLATSVEVTPKPVSQANLPTSYNFTLSDASGVTQSQYFHVLPNPPNEVEIVNDS